MEVITKEKFSRINKYEPATIYDVEMLTKAKEGLMELAMNKHPIETFDLYDLKNKSRSLSCHRMRFEQEAIKLNNLIHKLL